MKKNIKLMRITLTRGFFILLLTALCFCAASCHSHDDTSDLLNYIEALHKKDLPTTDTNPTIVFQEPLPPLEKDIHSPFPKIVTTVINQKKSPLERYPLDALHLVGLVQKKNHQFAVIATPDKKIYTVNVNDCVGNEQGRVTRISDHDVLIIEPANPSAGRATEKKVILRLQGSAD